jgi:hypothetical protein
MTIDRTQIGPLHKVYCALSGMEVQNTLGRIWAWERWLLEGWTEPDLVLVIKHLKAAIAKGERRPSSLMFASLIQDTERFEELLSLARALSRRPVIDTGRREVLRDFGRHDTPPTPDAKPVRDIIAGHKAFEAFREFGKNL